jgi:hypothetical protein
MKKKIDILAQPRSGGTLIKHFFSSVFPASEIKHIHNTHKHQKVDVLVVRDIRDSIMSGLRLYDDFNIKKSEDLDRIMKKINWSFLKLSNQDCGKVYEKNVTSQSSFALSGTERLNANKVIVLFYEDFVNNLDFVFNKIESQWGIKISEEKIEKIKDNLSLKNAKKIINYGPWGDKHVGDAKVGKWKKLVPLELHEKFSQLCGVPNKELREEEYFL